MPERMLLMQQTLAAWLQIRQLGSTEPTRLIVSSSGSHV